MCRLLFSHFDKILYLLYLFTQFVNDLELCYLSLKIFMLSKTNICSVQNLLRGNAAYQQSNFLWKNEKHR